MKVSYQNGAIVMKSHLFERAVYHVANDRFNTVFTGFGTLGCYLPANQPKIDLDFFLAMFFNGKPLSGCDEKTVYMIGRKQVTDIKFFGGNIKITQFLDKQANGAFTGIEFFGKGTLTLCLCGGATFQGLTAEDGKNFYRDDWVYAFSKCGEFVKENLALYFDLVGNGEDAPDALYSFFSFGETLCVAKDAVAHYSKYLDACNAEIDGVKLPKGALTEEQKAFYYSTYFCALENFKCVDDYQGFMAGFNYLNQMRTYYRDSYFTVLPMYNGHPELVRAEILTLARGVDKNGDCPSAVAFGFEPWWGNHYDSPSFLAIMLYDYIRTTDDVQLLSVIVDDMTVFERVKGVVEKLSLFADDTKLLFKEGKYNKRDWADAINRYGYVTYDNVLYARALFSLYKLSEITGNKKDADGYFERYEQVKKAVNDILWDDDLGYYVNFKNDDYTESNLSVDTVYAVIFGIADKDRAMRMLRNMENLLETKNNKALPSLDYGVMCVYPFYSESRAVYHKSSLPYCYHNGGNWPYLSAMYAYAKKMMGMQYEYPLYSWFDLNVQKGNFTPIEFFSPMQKDGSLLQAWSGAGAFVMFDEDCKFFD